LRILTKKTVVLFVIVITVFLLAVSAARGQNRFPLMSRIATGILAPLDFVFGRVAFVLMHTGEFAREMTTLYQENQTLRTTNDELKNQLAQMTEKAAENERLRAMVAYQSQANSLRLVAASVVGRDSATWTRTILINRGSSAGVLINMPVVTTQGLVGHVTESFSGTARVQLLTDPRSAAGGLVQRIQSRAVGIVEGRVQNTSLLRMRNLTRDADVIKGDKVVTSGFGGIFPKGLLVGEVIDVLDDEGGLLKNAIIRPAVDFSRLEDVFVITSVTLPKDAPK